MYDNNIVNFLQHSLIFQINRSCTIYLNMSIYKDMKYISIIFMYLLLSTQLEAKSCDTVIAEKLNSLCKMIDSLDKIQISDPHILKTSDLVFEGCFLNRVAIIDVDANITLLRNPFQPSLQGISVAEYSEVDGVHVFKEIAKKQNDYNVGTHVYKRFMLTTVYNNRFLAKRCKVKKSDVILYSNYLSTDNKEMAWPSKTAFTEPSFLKSKALEDFSKDKSLPNLKTLVLYYISLNQNNWSSAFDIPMSKISRSINVDRVSNKILQAMSSSKNSLDNTVDENLFIYNLISDELENEWTSSFQIGEWKFSKLSFNLEKSHADLEKKIADLQLSLNGISKQAQVISPKNSFSLFRIDIKIIVLFIIFFQIVFAIFLFFKSK